MVTLLLCNIIERLVLGSNVGIDLKGLATGPSRRNRSGSINVIAGLRNFFRPFSGAEPGVFENFFALTLEIFRRNIRVDG